MGESKTKSVSFCIHLINDTVIIKDYHVILIWKGTPSSVYDFDTILPFPCSFKDYCEYTIPSTISLPQIFQRKYRVIPADVYLTTFASDRSHMRTESGWIKPPPTYEPISTQESSMNLSIFMNMSENIDSTCYGRILQEEEFLAYFS
ncbi:Protein N-terminal glutamine amidohydrolase [Basidiobolus ranarum]|uniref:Protein N-terminal glutamine amidohydrolase n=1 Tax=Basidiobolus ranarum TaxID=34480 RepID=A0ABR2X3Z4_9FUNG